MKFQAKVQIIQIASWMIPKTIKEKIPISITIITKGNVDSALISLASNYKN